VIVWDKEVKHRRIHLGYLVRYEDNAALPCRECSDGRSAHKPAHPRQIIHVLTVIMNNHAAAMFAAKSYSL